MNLVDAIVLILIVLSAILGFTRGLVREVLGVGAWIGAAFVAVAFFPFLEPLAGRLITNPNLAAPLAFGAVFIATLILLSSLSHLLCKFVRGSMLSGLDRTLGIFFGVARAAAVLIIAYIVGGLLVTADHWTPAIRNSRSLPYIYRGAVWTVQMVPEQMRPRLQTPPDAADQSVPQAAS